MYSFTEEKKAGSFTTYLACGIDVLTQGKDTWTEEGWNGRLISSQFVRKMMFTHRLDTSEEI